MKPGSSDCPDQVGSPCPACPPPSAPSGTDPRRVVLVGNGASLLGRGLGMVIDGHDVVVRFNHFVIGRHAPDVGRKATVWFTGRGVDASKVGRILASHSFEEIHVHAWRRREQIVAEYRAASGNGIAVSQVEDSVIHRMRDYLGEGYSLFSTGAIGAWTMLARYRTVNLVGFDWWNRPARFHYSDGQRFPYHPGKGHQPAIEKRFFDKLAADGRLSFLLGDGGPDTGQTG